MKMAKTIFFSWTSSVPGNKRYINDVLNVIKQKNPDYHIDAADRNRKNSNEISTTILEKIRNCDYFIADVSIINGEDRGVKNKRLTPNPNVLYELGYASALEHINVILLVNKSTVLDSSELPFDIRNRPIISHTFSQKNSNRLVEELSLIIDTENIDVDLIRSIYINTKQGLLYTNQPEVQMNNMRESAMKGSLGFYDVDQSSKLPAIRRSLASMPELYELYSTLIKLSRDFRGAENFLDGGVSQAKILKILLNFNNTAHQIIECIANSNVLGRRNYTEETEDNLETLRMAFTDYEYAKIDTIEMFYHSSRCLSLYYDKILYAHEQDDNLKKLADILEKVSWEQMHPMDHDEFVSQISSLIN